MKRAAVDAAQRQPGPNGRLARLECALTALGFMQCPPSGLSFSARCAPGALNDKQSLPYDYEDSMRTHRRRQARFADFPEQGMTDENARCRAAARLDPLYQQNRPHSSSVKRYTDRSADPGLLTGGHILSRAVPGLAKTLAVRSLFAQGLHLSFSRIQCAQPDLLRAER